MILPELRGTIEFYVVIAAITMLALVFAYVWTLTQGGPGDATTTLEVYIYNTGEVQSLPGQAAAVATMLLGVMCPFIALLFWVRRAGRARRGRGGGVSAAADPRRAPRAGARGSPTCRSHVVLVGAALLALCPVLFMLMTALKTDKQYLDDTLGLPWPLSFGNFREALHGGDFFIWLKNSAIMTVGAVIVSTLAAALCAFAIARMRFRGQNLLLSVNIALLVVPPVVMLIPLFVAVRRPRAGQRPTAA